MHIGVIALGTTRMVNRPQLRRNCAEGYLQMQQMKDLLETALFSSKIAYHTPRSRVESTTPSSYKRVAHYFASKVGLQVRMICGERTAKSRGFCGGIAVEGP